jgi:hypothetical protein
MPSERSVAATVDAASDAAADASDDASSDTDADRSAGSTSDETIEWGPVRYDRIRSLAAGFGLLLLAALATVLAVLMSSLGSALLAAGPAALVANVSSGGIVLAVVLLVVAAIALTPLLLFQFSESASDLLSPYDGRFDPSSLRPRWIVAGAVAPAVAWWIASEWLAPGAFSLIPLVWLVPMIASRSGATHRLDPAAMTLERTGANDDRTRADDLVAVVRTRRIDLPWFGTTVFLLAYRGNAWFRSTPWTFVPADRADAVESALRDVLARSDGPDRASVAERVVLAVVGSSSLVVGATMALAAGEGAGGIALALLAGPFSLLFLTLAVRL